MISIDVLGELSRINVEFDYTDNAEWIKTLCPFHDDTNPSCGINVKDQFFKCQACGASGDVAKYIARVLKTDKAAVVLDLQTRYSQKASDKPIELSVVEKCHGRIFSALPLLEQLAKRGIFEGEIRKYRLGEERGRITIPIFNEFGTCVNIIGYAPGASQKKFNNKPGRGKPLRLYPLDQLEYDSVILCGGMLKAVAAASELNQHGIGAVSSTGGEKAENWPPALFDLIESKSKIYICLDVDHTGMVSAQKLANLLWHRNPNIYVVDLPLDKDKYPKGDLSDFVGLEKQKLWPLLKNAQLWEPPKSLQVSGVKSKANSVSIQQAGSASHANQRVKFKSLVSGVEDEAYYLPKSIKVQCDRKQDFCHVCPIMSKPIDPEIAIDSEDPTLLAMMNTPYTRQPELIKQALGMPPCKAVKFKIDEYFHVQHCLLSQDVDNNSLETDITIPSVSVDCPLEISETYEVEGVVLPHPMTQRATALLSTKDTVEDTLSSYETQPNKLVKFQPEDWTMPAIERKFQVLYEEIEQKVTRIMQRRDMHILYDLVWHSVLHFKAEGQTVKGWVEALVVGDSGVGKSVAYESLEKFYGLSRKVDCKLASAAGLLGGVTQINNRHFVTWGVMPANDRRMLCFEELKGARPEVIAKLTEARSSGKADVTKIASKQAQCRVRLLALSNSKSGNDVNAYAYGTEVIHELIPNLEDIRRFDIFQVPSRQEVPPDVAQQIRPEANNEEHRFPADDCRSLILWGWTRTSNQIKFEDWDHLLKTTSTLGDKFTDRIPIFDRGSGRYKVARLAIALAVRTFSHDESDPDIVLVRKCHVQYVSSFLIKLYSTQYFGYDRFSRAIEDHSTMKNVETITKRIMSSPFPKDLVECALKASEITPQDIGMWCDFEPQEAKSLMSLLVRNAAIQRDGRSYRKTPDFIALLQKLRSDNKLPDVGTPPDYVQGAL